MTVKICRYCHIVCFHHPLKILKAPSFERCGVYLLHVGVQSHRVVETWLNHIFWEPEKSSQLWTVSFSTLDFAVFACWHAKRPKSHRWMDVVTASFATSNDIRARSNRGRLRLVNLYRYFLALALLLVPFGRKRAICDHHRQLGFADLFQSFTVKVAHKRKDTSHWCCSRVITLKYQMSC